MALSHVPDKAPGYLHSENMTGEARGGSAQEIGGFAVGAAGYLEAEGRVLADVGHRREVSGCEAVERKGTGVQEAGADDAVEETYSPTTRPGGGMARVAGGRRRLMVNALHWRWK